MGLIAGSMKRGELRIAQGAQIFTAETQAQMEAAITAAVAGNGDVILLPRGGITVTSTIAMNKSGVRLIAVDDGLNPLVRGEFNGLLADGAFTDGPVMQVTQPCSLEGIGFVSRDTGALFFAGAALLLGGNADANPFGVHVKGCRFPKWGLDNRIGVAVEGSSDCLIEDCSFEGVGSALDIGIYVQGACQNLTIRNNHFRQCTAAIQYGAFAGGGPHAIIERNIVEDGLLLDSQGNTAPSFVIDNFSELAAGSTYDAVVGTLQGQGIQFAGNHYTE